jgi:UDP-N-acetyl-D-glucosamine/UDP-N-acetyl-D-galactosamine dehydrogenase
MTQPIDDLTNPDTPIPIIGLGYVGLPLAVEFAKHRPVIGFDINRSRIAELQAGRDSTRETSPEDLAAARDLTYTSDLDALRPCRIFIVTVRTPFDDYKRPDLTPLVKASETVAVASCSAMGCGALQACGANLRDFRD